MTTLGKFDWGLISATIFLMMVGLLTILSIDYSLFLRQVVWIVLGLILIFGLPFLNLKAMLSYRSLILGVYLVALMLLIATLFFSPLIHGTRGWLFFGPLQAQPSEFMKAALIILLSSFFATRHIAIAHFRTILASFLYLFPPTFIVLLQPDLGTAVVFIAIWFSYLLLSEIPLRHLWKFLVLFLVVGFLTWNFGLAEYQKGRIIGLLDPSYDPLGVNYSVIQSKIAIGSAGLFGKGFNQGSQTQLKFLPAAENDFIFSAFTEEWGILGAALLILAFCFLIYRILQIGLRSDNNFSRYLALGTATMILIHFLANVGSALGLLPVVGLNLPLVSYGGSNLLTVALLLGIILYTAEKRAGF